jgi:alpha-1,6-mannosyltransferase
MTPVTVHIDVLPAMTGVNLFQSLYLPRKESSFGMQHLPSVLSLPRNTSNMNWRYDKTEDLNFSDDKQWQHFTHLLSEDPRCHVPSQFELLQSDGFVDFQGLSRKPVRGWLSSLLRTPLLCLQAGLFHTDCLDALLPIQFHWRESVWLCQRRPNT